MNFFDFMEKMTRLGVVFYPTDEEGFGMHYPENFKLRGGENEKAIIHFSKTLKPIMDATQEFLEAMNKEALIQAPPEVK